MASRMWSGVWRLADPKISLASMASMFLGASVAARNGPLAPEWLALTVLGIFAIEVAKNASGEIVDFRSGADLAIAAKDRSPFSGGKRVIVDGLLTPRQTAVIAGTAYLVGITSGLLIAALRTPDILWVGVVGVACAFFYHAPPVKLSYRGLGELAVGLCYGPLIASGTYLVQRGQVSPGIILESIPLGLMIAAFLWINEIPDCDADRLAGKRTLVVRLGRRRAARVFAGLVAVTYAMLLLLPLGGVGRGVWLGLIGLVPGARAARTLLSHPADTVRIIPAQAGTVVSFVLMALGTGTGILVVR